MTKQHIGTVVQMCIRDSFGLSLGCSLSSLLGFFAPTADVSVLLGWALVVFVLITYTKIKTNGFGGYLKGFCDPVFVMAPFNLCLLYTSCMARHEEKEDRCRDDRHRHGQNENFFDQAFVMQLLRLHGCASEV